MKGVFLDDGHSDVHHSDNHSDGNHSDDGNPDSLLLSLSCIQDSPNELIEPDARIHYHSHHLVAAHEDAALRIIGEIARMDADALEARHALHQRQPSPEPRRPRHHHGISSLRYRRLARHLACLLTRLSAVSSVHLLGRKFDAQEVAPSRFQRIAEVMSLIKFPSIEVVADDALVLLMLAWTHPAFHLPILQDVEATYRIGFLLSYASYYYLHDN